MSIDNRAAARLATEHLLALGHRRIGHVCGPRGNILTTDRLAGYRAALADAGIAVDPALIAPGDFTFASGETAMRGFLRLERLPTALVCSNDEMAIGAMRAARQAGIAVPAELSVVGFDDIPIAAFCDPSLTTLHQPRRDMGRQAARLLMAALSGTPAPSRTLVLPHELVVRDSTAPPQSRG